MDVHTLPAGTDDYVEFCEGIRRLASLDLMQYKRGQMERRVRAFAERRGMQALPEYLALLERQRDELDEFLDRLTINVSQLWRNPAQWRLLATTVLPQLAVEHGTLRAWSVGCSYGAEAYTLAAICRRWIPHARVEIRGADVDPRVVERARRGWFSADDARDAPVEELHAWFAEQSGGWQAKPELLRLVRFEVEDVLRSPVEPGIYDLVICRNVVIYLTEAARDELHGRLASALRPGGYLMVGGTERVVAPASHGLVATHPFLYRKA